jgi:ATP-dependent DNA helicase RecQ
MSETINAQNSVIQDALRELWGYESFRPFQAETVSSILAGRDSLTVLPTGGGKSLCYQLPASVSQGTTIVISPLISLMADQVNALRLLGVPAAYLNSSLAVADVKATKAALFQGKLKLLYISPERLLLDHFLEELRQVQITFFAIDEAHCISQWGHDFRPEYQQLRVLKDRFPGISVHAFTATAPPTIQNEIAGALKLNQPNVFVGSYHRPNLVYRAIRRDKLTTQLLKLLRGYDGKDLGIIYCLTRKETERIAQLLQSKGVQALPYHAGLDAATRQEHHDQFSQEKIRIMVATVAFGMGIDQSNVRFVIHVGMPRSLSHYQQESGRAGRDGLPAYCTLIHSGQDVLFWKRIIEDEGALVDHRIAELNHVVHYATQIQCRHKTLIEHFGQPFNDPKCRSCDVCLGEIDSLPGARLISRKILSAVLKTREGFGGAYVSQVLSGSKEQKIIRNGHDKLTVYGLLKDHPQLQIHDWINQLESQGFLSRVGEYKTLRVMPQGYRLLRPDKYELEEADVPVYLTQTRKPDPKATKPVEEEGTFDLDLFNKLRSKRSEIAQELSVPAFMVFGDRSLRDMARKQPITANQFLQIFGVGQAKLDNFGEKMMEVIREYDPE